MRYSELTEAYEQLEKTPAKLAKKDIISRVLKSAPPGQLPKLVLLLIGRPFPAWSEEKLGVAGQLMIRAISKSIGVKPSEVTSKFNEIGDLGKTVEWLKGKKQQRTLMKKELTVDHVFESLQSIARQSESGSQERKLNLVVGLLAHASPKEARYIARTVLEELRVGVAEGIVRDAISDAFGIDVKVVEAAWSLLPDYGEIARIAKERGEGGLKRVRMEIGRPIIVLLAEKAPDLKSAIEAYENLVMEYKYDGMRVQIHKKGDRVWLFTRRLESVTKAFPDLVELAKECIKADNAIVEGEVLAIDPKTRRPMPFQMLSTRIKRKHGIEKAAKEIPIQVNLFDAVYIEGRNLFDSPLRERREELRRIVKPMPGRFQFAEQLSTKDLEKAEKFYKDALEAGQEGLIVKNLDALYVPGRRVAGGWLKVKPVMENLDLVIIGGTWGTGKRAGWLGSLVLGCRDPGTGKFLECGMLGTGLKEKKSAEGDVTLEELTRMLKPYIEAEKDSQVAIRPKVVVEVAYEEIQKSPTYSSGWALRFPRFIRLRPDKSPEEADSRERIKALHKIQKGKGGK
jgi:DNA ligase-1